MPTPPPRDNEEEKFTWTDELVAEFTSWSLNSAPTMQGRYADIKQFKNEKMKRFSLKTVDGIEIKDHEQFVYYVKDFSVKARKAKNITSEAIFSSELSADGWVLNHKPLISIAEIHEKMFARDGGVLDEIFNDIKNLAINKMMESKQLF